MTDVKIHLLNVINVTQVNNDIIQGPAEIPDDLATQLLVESLAWGICP